MECGVRWPVLQKALNYDLDSIDGCLLTHEHKDHSKAVKDVMRAGIDVYSSEGTFEALGVQGKRRAKLIESQNGDNLYFDCYGFSLNHDANEPLGYIVRELGTNEYLFFVPDSSHIKQRFDIKFSIIAIECSYDIDILKHRVDTQDINEALAKRLLKSHMEKQTAMNYLDECCDLSKCLEIHLLHMSADNIDKQATKFEFQKKFFIDTYIK